MDRTVQQVSSTKMVNVILVLKLITQKIPANLVPPYRGKLRFLSNRIKTTKRQTLLIGGELGEAMKLFNCSLNPVSRRGSFCINIQNCCVKEEWEISLIPRLGESPGLVNHRCVRQAFMFLVGMKFGWCEGL